LLTEDGGGMFRLNYEKEYLFILYPHGKSIVSGEGIHIVAAESEEEAGVILRDLSDKDQIHIIKGKIVNMWYDPLDLSKIKLQG
jgi:hypothetical protein